MRTLIATLSLLATIAPAGAAMSYSAHSRYNSTAMTCAEIQQQIHSEGAVDLRFQNPKDAEPRFDRYVDGIRFCSKDEVIAQASVPASDTKSCPVKTCVDAR
jgi:hypothetical protein